MEFSTTEDTLELLSLVFSCPANCGSGTLTAMTMVAPWRKSSPMGVILAFLKMLSCSPYALRARVMPLLSPTRCVPPSKVVMV